MASEHEKLHAILESEPLDFQALCASKDAIEFTHPDGRREVFTPDGFKGYFPFTVATAFPAGRIVYGIGIHPQVLANHYLTMLDQHVDVDHKMKFNDPKNANAEDNIIGSIAAVSFPRPPNGATLWKLTDMPQPAIQGVGVFWKNAAATKRALSNHVMGNKKSTVSMDVFYGPEDSGFAVKIPPGGSQLFAGGESPEFLASGYEYVSHDKAPKELRECFSMTAFGEGDKPKQPEGVTKDYEGRQVTFMAGGAGQGSVAFAGLAVVRYGAEPTAKLGHIVAAHPEQDVLDMMMELPGLLRQIGTEQLVKVEEPVALPAASGGQTV